MNLSEISKGIFYVGLNDRTLSRFEGLWPLPQGVSYNSYLVVGDKIALVDTVEMSHGTRFLEQLTKIIGDKPIDYLVINHMEPDHSGSIEMVINKYPNIKIVGNNKTAGMIAGYYHITENIEVISDGDEIDLGKGKALKFYFTPMVHWPETMMTLEKSSNTLFSGDAFGCYGALNGGIVDTEMEVAQYFNEMYRYYSNIVAKYGVFVQKAINKFTDVKVDFICPTHGPVWHNYVHEVVKIYSDLSQWKSQEGVVIAYGTMYGNTEELVDIIARQLAVEGIRNIKIYNMCTAEISDVLSDICRYKGFIIGGPTYSNCVFPPIEALLSAIQVREVKNKVFASFGSYTWAGGIVKKINGYLEKLPLTVVETQVEMKQAVSCDASANAKQLAKSFVEALRASEQG